MADRRDYYEILGVPRDAKPEDIQRSYRKLARTYHPDVNRDPGAEGRFTEISEAYDVLSDPDTRRRYDAFGHDFARVPEGVDPQAWARASAGGGAGARSGARSGRPRNQRAQSWFTSGVGGDADLEDLLGGMFGGSGWGRSGAVAGADQEAEIEVTVEEAFSGARRSVRIEGADGERTITVTIPAGVTEGRRIRLSGQGGRGSGGAPPGDLYFVVHVARHDRYRVEGRDLHVTVAVSPWEAALGTRVGIETPGGEAKAKIAPGTSSGRRLRLRGRGLPNPNGRPGDVIAEVRIMVPKSLTDQERRLFEELATASTFDPRATRR